MAGKTKTEDQWAFVAIGEPFPENPVRVVGENNMYVALWYKHGKPVCGRAWNEGGKLECSFAAGGKELTGAKELGGQIQVLTYKGSFDDHGYFYEWVPFRARNAAQLALVHCGDAAPILLQSPQHGTLLGNIDLRTEKTALGVGGKEVTGGALESALVIVRNHVRPDKPYNPTGENLWVDIRIGDPFPAAAVRGADRPLAMDDGTRVEHSVALWYKHGQPVMGRAQGGPSGQRVTAAFGWGGREHPGEGSIQMLIYTKKDEMGFEYQWRPYVAAIAPGATWTPVRVGDVAPCVVRTPAGHERLGQVRHSESPWLLL